MQLVTKLKKKLVKKPSFWSNTETTKTKPQSLDPSQLIKRRVHINLALLERPLMSATDFVIDIRYCNLSLVGSGSYGIVVKAYDSITSTQVAVKKLLNAFSSRCLSRHVLRELRLLRHLAHPNIIRLLDIDIPQQYNAWDAVYFVTPLLSTDLKSAFNDGKVKQPHIQKQIAYQMLVALEHLHSLGLMHRDVKPRNILLDQHMNVKLCDVGHSRFYSGVLNDPLDPPPTAPAEEPLLTAAVSTVIQSAPELSLGASYDARIDIWAAGCVIAEILHPEHRTLFDSISTVSHLQEIINLVGYPIHNMSEELPVYGAWMLRHMHRSSGNHIGQSLGSDVHPDAIDLLEKMLQFSSEDRIWAKDALQHKWFDDVRVDHTFEREEYNFGLSEPPKKKSRAELKQMIWEEALSFREECGQVNTP